MAKTEMNKAPDVSALNFAELQALQAQLTEALAVRKGQDLAALVESVKASVTAAGFELPEVLAALGVKPKKAKKPGKPATPDAPVKTRAKPEVKYRDEEGNEWTGRGQKPGWLREHLDDGREIEEFEV